MSISTIFNESFDFAESTLDNENRIIRNVVLIRAGMSANRRYYDEKVLENARAIFEGTKAYANHPSKQDLKNGTPRSFRDLTGWYSNVRYESGALIGDRHFLNTEAGKDAFAVAEAIINKSAPKQLAGLSINAAGNGSKEKDDTGEYIRVESITHAYSVDDVDNPAAGGAYALAASAGDDLANAIFGAMEYEQWETIRPDYLARKQKEWKVIRLAEETKRILAEADERVKAADGEAQTATKTLHEVQAELESLRVEHKKLIEEHAQLRLVQQIADVLEGIQLPAVYKDDLRKRLPQLSPNEWVSVIEIEKQKAQRANSIPNVGVTGAGVLEAKPLAVNSRPLREVDLNPRDSENTMEWQARITHAFTQ